MILPTPTLFFHCEFETPKLMARLLRALSLLVLVSIPHLVAAQESTSSAHVSVDGPREGDARYTLSLGVAFGPTSIGDRRVSDAGLGVLGRVEMRRFGIEFAAHHVGGNPRPDEIRLGSRHLLASYRVPWGRWYLRPALGIAWYQFPHRLARGDKSDGAVALAVGHTLSTGPNLAFAIELAGRAKLPVGEDSSCPRNVVTLQVVVSLSRH